jgi:hypothetical protein
MASSWTTVSVVAFTLTGAPVAFVQPSPLAMLRVHCTALKLFCRVGGCWRGAAPVPSLAVAAALLLAVAEAVATSCAVSNSTAAALAIADSTTCAA